MSKRMRAILAMICVVVLFVMCGNPFALADTIEAEEEGEFPLVLEYSEIPLVVDGYHIGNGILIDNVSYIPMLAFCQSMLQEDFAVEWDQETETVYMSVEGLDISLTLADDYIVANGRYLYLADGAYNINGTIIAPIRELAKIFGLDVEWSPEDWIIEIDTSDIEILESGDTFYDETSVYWLSRVINAEAGAEPMEGRIGVGNVVLNRVNDDRDIWRNTIKGVIFQPGQFAVAESGGVYFEPNEESVAAAKMCLDGYNTVGDSMFFFNPRWSPDTSWLDNIGTYKMTIANHVFYTYDA